MWTSLSVVDAAARFTRVPPSKVYVVKGDTARFEWDYHVDNRMNEFDFISPRWIFYDRNNKYKARIGYDNRFDGWKFTIDNRCPPRLLSPSVRVSKESNATLVITNVTMADSGIYGCLLLLSRGSWSSMPISKVELIVTDCKAFFTKIPPSKLHVLKGETVKLVWDYHVDDMEREFNLLSPRWYYRYNKDTIQREIIGFNNRFIGWKFQISNITCPPRLIKPIIRVSRQSNATIFITNVTVVDSGIYGCTLALKYGADITNEVHLIVADCKAFFTLNPPSRLYVLKGETVKLVWDYHVDNIVKEFKTLSPLWYYRYNKDTIQRKIIGFNNPYIGWKFQTASNTCPPRLLKPTVRVRRESNATLVITNVTMADSGIYGCTLALINKDYIRTEANLIVTAQTAILSPGSLVRNDGKDVVFQWNSSHSILAVRWGLANSGENKLIQRLIYVDKYSGPVINSAVSHSPYKGRVSFVGNLTLGYAWFKISNLTTDDTGYYGADVIPHFSKVPPKILYVPVGQAATLEWDYISSNKSSNFDPQSPRWEFYNSIDGWKTIGADYGTLGWQWKLSSSCPERLQNPTRVTKASVASLVIYNLTTEDSGLYRCNLTLRHRPPITNSTTLIVTAPPHFNRRPSSFVNIQEGRNLQISCSAVGPPTPNVSWVQVQGDSKATIVEGVGSVTLMIPNIKRDQNGTYECQAVNNPNQSPVTTQTTVNIMYPPSIDHSMSDNAITFFPQVVTRLRCVASGFPIPNITWYNSNEQRIKENVTSLAGYSEVSIYIENQKDYKCRAENVLGFIEHEVTVRGYENDAICYKTKIAKDKGGTELGRSTKKRYSSQKGVINISMDPVPPLSDHGLPYNTEQGEETAYEEPLDEPTVTDTSHNISYPYEIPQISDEMYVNTSDPSAARNYQELNTLEQISRDYQNLQGIRSTVRSPLGLQPEVAYEPLKKAQQPKYEPLNYQ
ncbi:Limbic system-associated membrane protein [Exaiptasia diaphana]|nr:Limbic system-associated membrane protein [Exaiptasia diaphana]